ncbi:MAG: sugar phosphate isomerase/epimerase [Lentisphaeria bacterium]|nr:sugar phosphate isomerase/epimerase [Lentisphaeria bacterium]
MYKALNYWVYGGFDGQKTPYEFIDFAKEMGLDGVELTFGDIIKEDITADECTKIREYAKSKNIGLRTMASGAYWGLSLASENEEERRKAVAFTRRYIEVASLLGVETILVIAGATRVAWDPSRPIQSYKSVWERSLATLEEIKGDLDKYQVNIGLENVWNRFLISPMEWKFYLEAVNHPRIGMYFDIGNCEFQVPAADFIEILEDKIKAIHVKNFKGEDSCGTLHGFGDDLLKGDVDFAAVKKALEAMNYQGTLTAEMIPFSRLPDLVLPDHELAVDTAKKLKSIL